VSLCSNCTVSMQASILSGSQIITTHNVLLLASNAGVGARHADVADKAISDVVYGGRATPHDSI
jgi:hypothetical protein